MSDRPVGFDPDLGYTADDTALQKTAGPEFWRKRRDEFDPSAAARFAA